VAAAFVQYVKVNPAVEPAVTAAAVRLTVAGAHTAAGLVIVSVGVGLTRIVLFADTAVHEPPVVVSVSVAVPLYAAGGVQVAFKVVAPGLKVPAAEEDHVPPVAEPPTTPPSPAEVPPWQMAVMAPPAFTVGRA
jgi:hypothetical protein